MTSGNVHLFTMLVCVCQIATLGCVHHIATMHSVCHVATFENVCHNATSGYVRHIATWGYVHQIVTTGKCSSHCDDRALFTIWRRQGYVCPIVTLVYVCHILTLLCLVDCNVTMIDRLWHMFFILWSRNAIHVNTRICSSHCDVTLFGRLQHYYVQHCDERIIFFKLRSAYMFVTLWHLSMFVTLCRYYVW